MSAIAMRDLVKELESRSITTPADESVLKKCTWAMHSPCRASGGAHTRSCTCHAHAVLVAVPSGHDASLRASASVEDVASTIEAVLMNNDTEEITEAVVAKVVIELVRTANVHRTQRRAARRIHRRRSHPRS